MIDRAGVDIHKRLAGVVVDTTSISTVVQQANSLPQRLQRWDEQGLDKSALRSKIGF